MKALMRDIPPTWLVDSELFPGKICVRLQLDEKHIYYAVVDFEEIVEAVKWRKEHEPDKKNWKHNIPLNHKDYWIIENVDNSETKISKMPAHELALFAAICSVDSEDDTIEIE